MNQWEISREQASFAEKIALSKLEAKKAEERVQELEYQLARFNLDVMVAICKQQAAAQPGPAPVQG